MTRSLYRLFATRMALAALTISLVLGGITYFYSSARMTEEVVALALGEAHTFASLHAQDLPDLLKPGNAKAGQQLERFLTTRESHADGHFAVAELYDAQRASVAEAVHVYSEAVEHEIDKTRHGFPPGDEPSYDYVSVDDKLFIRVVVLLRGGHREHLGYFEGVYQLADAKLAALRTDVLWTVADVMLVVLGTTLFLVPVIIGLNRHLVRMSDSLLKANLETLEVLGGAIAKRDSDTHFHNFRVTLYAIHLGEAVGLDPDTMRDLIKGAFLHDVGKIAIPDAILLKPGKLTTDEFEVMKHHVGHGIDIIARSGWLTGAAPVVRYHHEKYNGTGYPEGLAGEDIPITARIFAIADVFDALTSRRPYKEPMPFEKAMGIIEADSGGHFDPRLVAAFKAIARPLYQSYGQREDESVETALNTRSRPYFAL